MGRRTTQPLYSAELATFQTPAALKKERKRFDRGLTRSEAELWDFIAQGLAEGSSPSSSASSPVVSRRNSFAPSQPDKGLDGLISDIEALKVHARETQRYGKHFKAYLDGMPPVPWYDNHDGARGRETDMHAFTGSHGQIASVQAVDAFIDPRLLFHDDQSVAAIQFPRNPTELLTYTAENAIPAQSTPCSNTKAPAMPKTGTKRLDQRARTTQKKKDNNTVGPGRGSNKRGPRAPSAPKAERTGWLLRRRR